jgi:AcrR family transcriptional regulator
MSEKRRQGDDRGRPNGHAARARDLALRRDTERAVLQLSGEVGYEQASVAVVVARSGSNLTSFYRTYAGKAACYAAAYDSAAASLCTRLLAASRGAPDWTAAMKRALLELEAYASEDPALAAGVIAEVHVAGGTALARRAEIAAHLARAIDRGPAGSPRQPPSRPSTARFLIEAIEAAVVRSLADKTELREVLPGLLFLAVAIYFDASEASRQVRGWPGDR